MNNLLILGMGVVGNNLKKELDSLNIDVYDKYKNIDTRSREKYDIAFICVDTPFNENNVCDISEVENCVRDTNADVIVIKSTILPGTSKMLSEKYGKNVVFSPEYYGGTQHCNNFDFKFTILGGDIKDCVKVVQVLQSQYDARHKFRIVDSKTAEMTKYMENAFLATKVSFCNEFYDFCQKEGISYEQVRELFILDERINPSHTFVYENQRYWDSHCLNKDVPAIAEKYDSKLLKEIIRLNNNKKQ